jgi:hypothetical protein
MDIQSTSIPSGQRPPPRRTAPATESTGVGLEDDRPDVLPCYLHGSLTARVVPSLRAFSDAELDRATASASVFFDRRWLRMLDALDLEPLLRGALSLRYVVVTRGSEPVAICPFFVTRSASMHFAYSFDKSFFTGWQGDLVRINPEMARFVGWLSRLVEGYRRLAKATGALADGWVIVASPLSFRGSIAVAALSAGEREKALGAVIEALQGVSADENAPIWFFRIPEEERDLRRALAAGGFDEAFMLYDNLLDGLEGGVEGYLSRFRTSPRSTMKREMAKARRAGVRFEHARRPAGLEPEMARLYEATYSKYGPEYFAQPPSFWTALDHHLGSQAEAILAYRGDRLLGFTLLLHKGDLWAFRIGKVEDEPESNSFLYFNLAFYEPIRRASELGAKRLWLGPGGYHTKHHRGAIGAPLYGAFWFPSRRSRALLLPYLKAFAHVAREELAFSAKASVNAKVPT